MWTTATSRRTQGEPTSESEHRVAALRTRRNARPRTETAMLKRHRVQTATRVETPALLASAGGRNDRGMAEGAVSRSWSTLAACHTH